jgi:uroporphyrinogen III methyltransferase/synthase
VVAEPARIGKVYLVGAGPGDPTLLTVRARDLIDSADAIVYHSRALSQLLPPGAKERGYPDIYFVGESRRGQRPSREDINELVSSLARSGKNVVRLMRGDPFLLNRGSEEAQHLNDCAIEFEIVPGIPEGVAAAAHAGIPLTHTDLSSSVSFLDNRRLAEHDAKTKRTSSATETIVIGPGVDSLAEIAGSLIRDGMSPDVPAATIQHPGTVRQRIVTGKLGDIADSIRDAGVAGRAVTIVGYTVVLGYELGWLERKPLFGKRVAVADAPSVSGRLSAMLTELGAEVTEMPETLSQRLHVEWNRDVWTLLESFQWLVFVGSDAVAVFWEKLLGAGRDSRALASQKIAAVGAAAVRALLERGITADVIPTTFDVEAIAEVLRSREDLGGSRCLVLAAEDVDDHLLVAIREGGGSAQVIMTSRSVTDDRALVRWKERLSSHPPDAIAFTSARSVRRFVEAVGDAIGTDWRSFSIGGSTSQALRDVGMKLSGEAEEPTLVSVVEAIRRELE